MPGTFPASPDVDNLQIATGILYFSEDNGVTWVDLGECPNFTISPDVTTKTQDSSRGGVKSTLVERVTKVNQTAKFDLLEVTPDNVRFFALGDPSTDSDGNLEILGLTNSQISGKLQWVGDNDVGQRITWTADVQFKPSGDFNFVQEGDDYTKVSLTATITKDDNGAYGVWTFRGVGG